MIERFLTWIDDRLGTAHFVSHALRKAFPDHWSFMLGEINMYAFLVLLGTGTFLAFFFEPSSAKTTYHGPYALLDGVTVSQAYASALRLSFEVNGGLLLRQVHHWTALIFLAGIVVHMGRIFFTGAFRKPREINWIIGIALFMLAILAGFTGYSLPDDLVSGTGLRIADSIVLSIPFIGAWASFLLLNGTFPTAATVPRLFVAHVYLIPLSIAALMTLHLAVVWRQKHTQFPGLGRTEDNVVGSPLFPQYALKSVALLCALVAVVFGLGALVQINPVWLWGPYEPWKVVNPVQPDWYVGWLDGALRLGPGFPMHILGHTIPSTFLPGIVMPAVLFTALILWPWIDARARNDRASHHLLERPRDVPMRTALGVAVAIFAIILTLAGSGDVQARYVHQPVNVITHAYQVLAIAAPIIGFFITLMIARELRRRGGVHQAQRVRLRRNADGGFDEEPIA